MGRLKGQPQFLAVFYENSRLTLSTLELVRYIDEKSVLEREKSEHSRTERYIANCYGLNCVPANSFVEVLMPSTSKGD